MTQPRDWDDAYANMKHTPGAEALPAQWAADAMAYRKTIDVKEIAYGGGARQKLDLILPDETPRGLAVFVHGGYWMKFAKSDWTHFAAGAVARGWAVCLPQYTLAPDARIAEMTREIGAAITCAAGEVAGPLRLAGHSAGGQLVSRMVCADTPLASDVVSRVSGAVSISGLHDLRALLKLALNETLHVDMAEAIAESAALQVPLAGTQITAWVGGGERPEFIRQSQLLEVMWRGFDVDIACIVEGSLNHFNVIDALRDPQSPLTRRWLGDDT